jgi:hypothetical protein
MLAGMASRRNSAVKIYVNGSTANDLYGLAKRVGQQVPRLSVASQRAQASLARKVQPVAKREIRNIYGVKASVLNNKLKLETGARKNSDYISLWASTRKISLMEFSAKWRGVKTPGATASILLGTSKTYDAAFIATLGSQGKPAVYVRSRGPDGKRAGRGPLRRLYGPSVFEMIGTSPNGGSNTVRNTITPKLQDFYVTELTRQIALELRRG